MFVPRPLSFEIVIKPHALVLEEEPLVAERARRQLRGHPDVGDVLLGAARVPISWLVSGPHLEQGSTFWNALQLLLEADDFTGIVDLLITAKKISNLGSGDVSK